MYKYLVLSLMITVAYLGCGSDDANTNDGISGQNSITHTIYDYSTTVTSADQKMILLFQQGTLHDPAEITIDEYNDSSVTNAVSKVYDISPTDLMLLYPVTIFIEVDDSDNNSSYVIADVSTTPATPLNDSYFDQEAQAAVGSIENFGVYAAIEQ